MERPVSIADAEVAGRIARSVRDGGPADRAPTAAQLLSAFGESHATPEALARVAAALAVAGVTVSPPLTGADLDDRLTLSASGRKGRSPWRVVAALALIGVVLGGAALASSLGGDEGNAPVADELPDTTTAAATPTPTPTTAVATAPTPRPKTKAKAKPKPAAQGVSVVLTATTPAFVCVEDRTGRQLFNGTLSGRRRFRARLLRFNIGLSSTEVRINGKPYALDGSPTGLEVTRKTRKLLPLGERPC